MNSSANDSAIDMNKILNFPNLQDVMKIRRESSSTEDEKIQEMRDQRRARSHSLGTYSGWIYKLLKEVKLPQIF